MKSFLLFILLFFSSVNLFSQNDSVYLNKMVIVFTNDGGRHIGQLLAINDHDYYLSTKNKGNVFIPKYVINKIELVTEENFVNNKYMEKINFILTTRFPPMLYLSRKGMFIFERHFF